MLLKILKATFNASVWRVELRMGVLRKKYVAYVRARPDGHIPNFFLRAGTSGWFNPARNVAVQPPMNLNDEQIERILSHLRHRAWANEAENLYLEQKLLPP